MSLPSAAIMKSNQSQLHKRHADNSSHNQLIKEQNFNKPMT